MPYRGNRVGHVRESEVQDVSFVMGGFAGGANEVHVRDGGPVCEVSSTSYRVRPGLEGVVSGIKVTTHYAVGRWFKVCHVVQYLVGVTLSVHVEYGICVYVQPKQVSAVDGSSLLRVEPCAFSDVGQYPRAYPLEDFLFGFVP